MVYDRSLTSVWPLWIAFFVSGIAGLSYELTWVRYLGHLFGTTTPAVAATVALFFFGTSVGAWVGGRWFASRRRPILAYAGLEASIGVAGLALPTVFAATEELLSTRPGAQSLTELLLASGAVLLLPTIGLGATFPAMLATLRGRVAPTRATALLYGLNTLGAVLGCLLVSLWWLPSLGLRATSGVLGALNLAVAASMMLVHRFARHTPLCAPSTPTSSDPTPSPKPTLAPRRALVLAAGSGFVAIAIEVQWVRALSLSFPATVYVFALVLAAYLVGIGLGSSAMGRLYRLRAPKARELLATYVVAGLGCFFALNLLPRVGPWSLELLSTGSIASFGAYLGWIGGISVLSMLPATLAMGAALPILVGLAAGERSKIPALAGRIYGANTMGGVVGSLAGTFFMMPMLGLSRSLSLLALAYLALALAVPTTHALQSARRGLLALLALGGLVAALDLQPEVNALREPPGTELLLYRDSPSGTVAVYENAEGIRSLRINNQYTLSNTAPATVAMQYRLGLIPMALHPAPRHALLIGFATGTTLAAMASADGLVQLDCVELHDIVFDLAPYFARENHEVWRDPTVQLLSGDGRRHLARPGPRYDLVVEDLFVPRNPGVGSLYSVEHFEAVRERLAEGGVFVVWLPLWQLGPQELASIVRTFVEVFPDAEAWQGRHGPERPILGLVSGARGTEVRIDLRDLLPNRGEVERARRVYDTATLQRLAKDAPLNTLDRPFVELAAPRSIMRAKLDGRSLLAQTLEWLEAR